MNSAADIEARAAAWIVRLDGADSEYTDDLHAWLAADPRHRAAYARLAEAWRRTARLERLRPPDGSPDPDLLAPRRRSRALTPLSRRNSRIRRPKAHRPRGAVRKQRLGTTRWHLAAMGLAALAAVGLGLWLLQALPRTRLLRTGAGGLSRVVLADGSSVILNSNTLVRVHFTPKVRSLWLLKGEAQFIDTHDVHRPFEVHAGGRIVLAVGTAFDVRLAADQTLEVAVTEGRVAVVTSGTTPQLAAIPPPVLTAGEIARVSATRLVVDHDTPRALSRRLAWESRQLSFRGETLGQAVAEFNRYNSRKLAIADSAIESLRIGGNFDALDTASFVAALQHSFGITSHTSDGGTIYLSGPSSH